MAPKYICICFEDSPNKIYDDSRYKNCTVQKLISKKILEDKFTTFIHKPNFMIALAVTEVPLKTYPELLLTQKPTQYKRPDYYLYQTKNLSDDTIILYIGVRSNTNYDVLRIPFHFKIHELNVLTIGDMKKRVLNLIGNDGEIVGFKADEIDVFDDDEYMSNYIDFENPKTLVLEIVFSNKFISKIQLRENLINEIRTTEEKFKNDLKLIEDSQAQFKQKNLLSDSEYNLIFHEISFIKKNHSNFFKRLTQEEKLGYGSMISVIFLEMIDALKTSQKYISLYPSITELINIKKQNRAFVSCLTEFQQNNGRDLSAFLITPVQRLPRYLLFLRELTRITPQIHPDSELLPLALKTIEKLNQETDCLTKQTKQQTILKEIEDKLKKYDITLVDPSRRIIMLVDVVLKDQKKVVQAQLCLCNDLVFFYVDHGKTAKLIYSQSLYVFHYLPITGEYSTIAIPYVHKVKDQYERTEFTVSFSKLEEKMQFLDNIQYHFDDFVISQEKKHKGKPINRQIYWNLNSISDSLPTIFQHSCISNRENVIFYGGISSSQRLICSDFSSYRRQYLRNVPLSEMTTMESGIFGRRKCTFTYLNDYFYVIGGFVGSKEVSEMMRYDINTGKWHQFCIKQIINLHSHTCVPYKNMLYVYGGKSKENGYNSEIYLFNTENQTMEIVNVTGEKPRPRAGHSAVVYNEKMYIFGGKYSKGILSDLWSFDFKDKKWKMETLNDFNFSRKCHLAFVLGSEMLVIGGISEKEEAKSFTIDLNNFTINSVEDYGNFPSSLHFTSGAVLNNHEIVIYGGIEFKSKSPLSTLYILNLSPSWKKYIKSQEKNTLFNDFDQEKWNELLNSKCCHTIITHRSTYNPQKDIKNNMDNKKDTRIGKEITNENGRRPTSRRASIAALMQHLKPQAKSLTPKLLSFGDTFEYLVIEKIDTNDIVKVRQISKTAPKSQYKSAGAESFPKGQVEQPSLTPRQLIEYKKSIRNNSVRCKTINGIYKNKVSDSIRRGTIQSKTINLIRNDIIYTNPDDINHLSESNNKDDQNLSLKNHLSISSVNNQNCSNNQNDENLSKVEEKITPKKRLSYKDNKQEYQKNHVNTHERYLPNYSFIKNNSSSSERNSNCFIQKNDTLVSKNGKLTRSQSSLDLDIYEENLSKEKNKALKESSSNQNLEIQKHYTKSHILNEEKSSQIEILNDINQHNNLEICNPERNAKKEQKQTVFQPLQINPRINPKSHVSNIKRTCKRWNNDFENLSQKSQDNV